VGSFLCLVLVSYIQVSCFHDKKKKKKFWFLISKFHAFMIKKKFFFFVLFFWDFLDYCQGGV